MKNETSSDIIDPWSLIDIKDYDSLLQEFGIQPIEDVLPRIPDSNKYIRRRIIFGHTELERVLEAVEKNESYAVMSGIKPSGPFHVGSKMTAEEIIFFQKMSSKGRAFYCIADYEAYADNRQSLEDSFEVGVSHLADVLALGLDPDRAYIYRQSADKRVLDMAFAFSRDVTYNMMEAIYGEKNFGLYLSALVQVGDILLPETQDFGGRKPVVVPVGADQAPHIRLSRDIARRYSDEKGFLLPSATYHKLVRSLTGSGKMSKREPMGLLALTDDPKLAIKKIMMAFTGGRETIRIQKELGGEPSKCVIYEYLMFHFLEDDTQLSQIYRECMAGERTCGLCKEQTAEIVACYLKEHQQKRLKMLPIAREILNKQPST